MDETPVARIARYIAEGRCALFVGPDLSESAGGFRGLPTSWQLADELAARSEYRGRFRTLPQVAQIYARKHGRVGLIDHLCERLGAPEYRPLPVHEIIARIPFPVVVSGGWDVLLEQALTARGVRFRSVRANYDLPFIRSGSEEMILFKPYGSIDMPESMRVTETDQLGVFYNMERVIERLKVVIEEYVLLLVGYSLAHDAMFVRIYDDIRRLQESYSLPAFAVQSLFHAEDATIWDSYGIETIIARDPALFLRAVARATARIQGRALDIPALAELSSAPRLTVDELARQGDVLNAMLDQLGVADLIEQTDIPLLSAEQLRDIEVMRAVYERLAQSFEAPTGSARVWLRQGNLEYARENYPRAEEYYRRALASDPDLADAHHNMHYVQLALGNNEAAITSYWRAVSLQPDLAILPDRYVIAGVLGSGGMGSVYLAWDMQTGPVAVKLLHRARALNERALALFRREAELLRRMNHPGIVRLIDFSSFGGSYFIAMDYVKGRSLDQALKDGPFSLDQTFVMTRQICDALAHAHASGVIHRDLKPSNVLIAADQIRLIDFGLARPLAAGEPTVLGQAAGTVSYMAPELAEGLSGDIRTDVYGAASLCYQMLTGRNPNQGSYAPPSELVAGLTSEFDAVIERGRALRPDDRYPTATAFCDDLRRVTTTQAASAYAPLSVRVADRAAHAARTSVERMWPLWLLVCLALGVGSAILVERAPVAGPLVAIARYAATTLLLLVAIGGIARPFTATAARRLRATEIAVYGPLLGLALGAICAHLWLRSFRYSGRRDPWLLGAVGNRSFTIFLVASLTAAMATALGVMWIAPQLAGLARRRTRSIARSYLLIFLACMSGLLALSLALPFGWLSDITVPGLR